MESEEKKYTFNLITEEEKRSWMKDIEDAIEHLKRAKPSLASAELHKDVLSSSGSRPTPQQSSLEFTTIESFLGTKSLPLKAIEESSPLDKKKRGTPPHHRNEMMMMREID